MELRLRPPWSSSPVVALALGVREQGPNESQDPQVLNRENPAAGLAGGRRSGQPAPHIQALAVEAELEAPLPDASSWTSRRARRASRLQEADDLFTGEEEVTAATSEDLIRQRGYRNCKKLLQRTGRAGNSKEEGRRGGTTKSWNRRLDY
jgi:hypothetical protein